jgi:hypothetical protein
MTREFAIRILMTIVLAAGAIASFILDWRENHLLNPLWHPHARFHGALLLFMLAGVSATGIWLMWRKSLEPEVATRAAALLSLSFWTPLFYVTTVLPGANSWAGAPEADPRLHGAVVTPNLLIAAALVAVNLTALAMSSRRIG